MLTFQQENNAILKNTIEDGFFKYFTKENKQDNERLGIEIFITPECNQNCSYCYLCSHGDKIYPKELRDKETIKNNFKIFLNYCVEKKLKPDHFDLFSGEIWESDFGIEIFTMLVETLEKQKDFMPRLIMIPSNCSFIYNPVYRPKIENLIERIQNNPEITSHFCFSCSNDGKIIDAETRPFNDKNKQVIKGTDEYYEKLMEFCKKYNFAFHPMVSAHCIEKWSENFLWWMNELNKYELDPLLWIMFLETRNNNWSEDKIIHYLKFLNTQIEYYFNEGMKRFKGNPINSFVKYLNGTLNRGYNKYNSLRTMTTNCFPTCSLPRTLTVRLGDLAIVPCHRTSYEEYVMGYFKVENDKIVDIIGKNIPMMNQIWFGNNLGMAKCSYCPYKILCTRGCYGAQLENNNDMFYPCDTVCDLYKARIIFLYEKYKKMNIIDKLDNKNLQIVYQQIKDTDEYHYWNKIIQNII